MSAKAKLKHLHIAPRKVRLVVDMIRGKNVDKARNSLNFTTKRATKPVLKLLNSAVANADENHDMDLSRLFIKKITVDEGPTFKRWLPRARGSADEIKKRTSHVTIILEEKENK